MFTEVRKAVVKDTEFSVDVYHGVTDPEITSRLWDCYETAFHAGTGGARDFVNHEDFAELLAHLDTIAMVSREPSGKMAGFLIFSRDHATILRWAMKDTAYLTAQARDRNVYWVFLYVPCSRRHYLDGYTHALFTALKEYVSDRHGVIAFDQDPESGLADNIFGMVGSKDWELARLETIETVMFRPAKKVSQ